MATAWLGLLPAGRVFTAERAAYRNLLLGMDPPDTARHRNPFRQWIGAQIRTELYGWANPGRPDRAAELAYADASVSHVRNGVYGALYTAALGAAAMVESDVERVLDAGLAIVPPRSRFAEAVDSPERRPSARSLAPNPTGSGSSTRSRPATATCTGCMCSTTPRC